MLYTLFAVSIDTARAEMIYLKLALHHMQANELSPSIPLDPWTKPNIVLYSVETEL